MPTAEVTRRTLLFIAAAVLLAAAQSFVEEPSVTLPDTLPASLSDKEFWRMITDFSEAGGYFRSDNFLSNEIGYQGVIPGLRKSIRRGGVYLGVGPEQNFTYIVGLEPKMAFIVDIRRQNMLEHLLYKALMELSADRTEFLSRLFSRARPPSLARHSTPDGLVRAYQTQEPSADLFDKNITEVLHHLETTKAFNLSREDEASLRYVYKAFFESGLDLTYTFIGGYRGGGMDMPTYGQLMNDNDGRTHNWNFLASEDQYEIVRRLQQRNLIVPIVGDFAGPQALRAVADYLKEHNAVLNVFYTSNVEQYLFQDDENWKLFYSNVSTLPVDSSSTFIRYVLNSWRFNQRSRTVSSPIEDVLRAYDHGRIRSYWDVVDGSR
jgi:hypothetical protein